MPSALVIGLDLDIRDNPPVSELLAHENQVRTEFLAGLTGWTCDIVLVTNRTLAPIDGVTFLPRSIFYGGVEIVQYVTANQADYDLFIMSYIVDDIYRGNLKAIPDTIGKPLFMPMPNTSANWNRTRTNIINVGAGSTENIRGFGQAIWFYDLASGGSTLTSYTTATVARKATQIIEAGYTSFDDIASILTQNGTTFSEANGFGRLPSTLTIFEPEVIPTPEPIPPHEPELTPYNPNPELFLTRSGTTNTLSTDGGGSVQTFQRRNNIDAEWQTVQTTDTQPTDQTFMYRVQVSDSVTSSAYSDTVYSAATSVSPRKFIILP
jgi:hypothetical protein